MVKANVDIRTALMERGVYQKELAERLEVQETSLSSALSKELTPIKKRFFMMLIDEIAKEREVAAG